jgi:hypothetical protein
MATRGSGVTGSLVTTFMRSGLGALASVFFGDAFAFVFAAAAVADVFFFFFSFAPAFPPAFSVATSSFSFLSFFFSALMVTSFFDMFALTVSLRSKLNRLVEILSEGDDRVSMLTVPAVTIFYDRFVTINCGYRKLDPAPMPGLKHQHGPQRTAPVSPPVEMFLKTLANYGRLENTTGL